MYKACGQIRTAASGRESRLQTLCGSKMATPLGRGQTCPHPHSYIRVHLDSPKFCSAISGRRAKLSYPKFTTLAFPLPAACCGLICLLRLPGRANSKSIIRMAGSARAHASAGAVCPAMKLNSLSQSESMEKQSKQASPQTDSIRKRSRHQQSMHAYLFLLAICSRTRRSSGDASCLQIPCQKGVNSRKRDR